MLTIVFLARSGQWSKRLSPLRMWWCSGHPLLTSLWLAQTLMCWCMSPRCNLQNFSIRHLKNSQKSKDLSTLRKLYAMCRLSNCKIENQASSPILLSIVRTVLKVLSLPCPSRSNTQNYDHSISCWNVSWESVATWTKQRKEESAASCLWTWSSATFNASTKRLYTVHARNVMVGRQLSVMSLCTGIFSSFSSTTAVRSTQERREYRFAKEDSYMRRPRMTQWVVVEALLDYV